MKQFLKNLLGKKSENTNCNNQLDEGLCSLTLEDVQNISDIDIDTDTEQGKKYQEMLSTMKDNWKTTDKSNEEWLNLCTTKSIIK